MSKPVKRTPGGLTGKAEGIRRQKSDRGNRVVNERAPETPRRHGKDGGSYGPVQGEK